MDALVGTMWAMKCIECRSLDTLALGHHWCCLNCGATFNPDEQLVTVPKPIPEPAAAGKPKKEK